MCCNDGQGGDPSCKLPANGGFCPVPGAWSAQRRPGRRATARGAPAA